MNENERFMGCMEDNLLHSTRMYWVTSNKYKLGDISSIFEDILSNNVPTSTNFFYERNLHAIHNNK